MSEQPCGCIHKGPCRESECGHHEWQDDLASPAQPGTDAAWEAHRPVMNDNGKSYESFHEWVECACGHESSSAEAWYEHARPLIEAAALASPAQPGTDAALREQVEWLVWFARRSKGTRGEVAARAIEQNPYLTTPPAQPGTDAARPNADDYERMDARHYRNGGGSCAYCVTPYPCEVRLLLNDAHALAIAAPPPPAEPTLDVHTFADILHRTLCGALATIDPQQCIYGRAGDERRAAAILSEIAAARLTPEGAEL